MSSKDDFPREKRWKNLYTRSVKLARAQQLGLDYPRTTEKQLIQEEVMAKSEGKSTYCSSVAGINGEAQLQNNCGVSIQT